jgi:cephalosporin-C deacetylase-like acetyl esterase
MNALAWGPTLVLLAVAVGAAGAAEGEDLNVLPAGAGREMLRQYLLGECGKCFEARRKGVAALDTPEKIVERQKRQRADWIAANGLFPDRTPLAPRVTGILDRADYRVEKVLYESRPNHHVTANLYVPKGGQPPYPGVLMPCGHSDNGKADKGYQSLALLLVRHGFVVLSYDPIGQGERCQLLGDDGKPVIRGVTEHTLTDLGARLVGWGAATYRIWDGIRSLDYLASRPEVDENRLGCTGNSGGGTMTSYLMVTDDRILAAAPSCYITSFERLFATIGPQDGEQNVTGQVALGIDHADYLTMRAPKPTLVLAATRDFFDIDGTWQSFREAKRVYGILGHGERVDLFEFPDEHAFSQPRREAALRWMLRWLQGIDDAPTEPPLELFSDAQLQVTEGGQVVRDFKGTTVWDLTLARAKALAAEREAFWRDRPKAECLAEVRRLAGIRSPTEKPAAKAVGTVERDACRIEKLLIERPGEVPVPALLFVPKAGEGKRPAILYVDGRGKAADAAPGGPIEELVKAGHVVLSIDARGFGETAAVKPKDYWHEEFSIAYLAIHLARPLLGQRVEDALTALDLLAARPEVDAARLSIVGVERGGPAALHAAALDERLGGVTVRRSIESWMDVVATPMGKDQVSQVVPAALTRYDLPDLARAIAPRRVNIVEPVDPKGEPKKAP